MNLAFSVLLIALIALCGWGLAMQDQKSTACSVKGGTLYNGVCVRMMVVE